MNAKSDPPPYHSPTVVEASRTRLLEVERQIRQLSEEAATLRRRIRQYAGSQMLESERRATRAEPFQTTQLPSQD
jgi:hypothetical protein